MSIKVRRTHNIDYYKCPYPKCKESCYDYISLKDHMERDHSKKFIQTNFKDNSLNNYELIKLSGGVEE